MKQAWKKDFWENVEDRFETITQEASGWYAGCFKKQTKQSLTMLKVAEIDYIDVEDVETV